MHPADELEFEELLVSDPLVRFIAGPRWETEAPKTTRSLADIGRYCIIWASSDLSELRAEYIPSNGDWYCRSEYGTIQFLRSEIDGGVITEGRIAVSADPTNDFPDSGVKGLEKRFRNLRRYIRKHYSNSAVRWCNPSLPIAPAGTNRSANPSDPDPQVWIGPHAMHWLRGAPSRRLKQFRNGNVEAVLV